MFFCFMRRIGCACLLGLCPFFAIAQSQLPLWEVGATAIAISQPAYPGSNEQAHGNLLLPYAVYRGPIFKADRGGAGVRVVHEPTFEVDVSASLTLGFNPNGVVARQGMQGLGTLLQVGPRAIWNLGTYNDLRWQVQWPVREVVEFNSGLHARGIATEPEIRFETRHSPQLSWGMSAGALVGDRKLNQLFYAVGPGDATANRPAYEAKAGLMAWRLSLFGSYQLSPDLRIFMHSRWDDLHGAANVGSPLVKSQNGIATTVGLIYVMGRSPQKAAD